MKVFKPITEIINISVSDMKRIDAQINDYIKKSKYFEEFAKKIDKYAKNEEELKYIWFRIGQIEMLNTSIDMIREFLRVYFTAGKKRLGLKMEEGG